jgi:hypothetical protein
MSITANIYGYGSNLIHTYYNLWWNCMFLYSYWPLQVSLLLMDGMLDAFKPLNAFHCVALHVERDGVWLRLLLFFFSSPFLLSSLFLPLSLSHSLSLSLCLSFSVFLSGFDAVYTPSVWNLYLTAGTLRLRTQPHLTFSHFLSLSSS